jgi:hypothetical protein
MEWVINPIGNTSLCQLLFPIVMHFFYDQNRALIQISECDLSVFHSNINHIIKMKDAISSPRSIFLGNLHSFLNSLDETRLADIKFKRSQQGFNSSNYQRMCISRILVAYKGWINVAEAFLNAYESTLAFLHI